mmetsp:Transcript_99852/g.187828  ORF Transcript_99852/g.187828 Transcript_99852/m.187828 type:complete len:367 (-) Transcript_99852:55-1155(-)
MIPVIGGTHANLDVDPAVVEAVEADGTRAVKVVVDKSKLTVAKIIKEGASLEEDFATVAASVEDDKPCLMILRVTGLAGIPESTHWAMLAWSPDDAPARAKLPYAASRKTVQEKFEKIGMKEYQATTKDELTLAALADSLRALTESERRAAMTQAEIDLEAVKKEQEQERASAPKMLAGLAALQIKVKDSFMTSVFKLTSEEGKVVLGLLSGPKNEELRGEVLDDVAAPSALKGKLPAEPCYVLMRAAGEKRLLLLSWLHPDSGIKLRMNLSTFKASTVDKVKELTEGWTVFQKEVTDEDDLVDDLIAAPAEPTAEEKEEAASAAAPKKKPPVGGMALPGMGGMPLPGMGRGMPVLKKVGGAGYNN